MKFSKRRHWSEPFTAPHYVDTRKKPFGSFQEGLRMLYVTNVLLYKSAFTLFIEALVFVSKNP